MQSDGTVKTWGDWSSNGGPLSACSMCDGSGKLGGVVGNGAYSTGSASIDPLPPAPTPAPTVQGCALPLDVHGHVDTPVGWTEVPDEAFLGCIGLRSVNIGSNIASIGESAFAGCTALDTVTFTPGSTLTSIASKAFQGTALSAVSIPATVDNVAAQAFDNCHSLSTVVFEAGCNMGALYLGPNAFSTTNGIRLSINLPAAADCDSCGASIIVEACVPTFAPTASPTLACPAGACIPVHTCVCVCVCVCVSICLSLCLTHSH